MFRTLLYVTVFLWGGCEVDVGEIAPLEHTGQVDFALDWPADTNVNINMCYTPEIEVLADADLGDYIQARSNWALVKCSEAPGDEALWLRPPEGCGTYFARSSSTGVWCAGVWWHGCLDE
jgi:hypothetical protein